MASAHVREKLACLLNKRATASHFGEDIKWLATVKSWINFHCPTLQSYLVKGKSIAWLVVHPSPEKLEEIKCIDVRILINLDKSFHLQGLKSTVQEGDPRVLSDRECLLPLLHSFEVGSEYTVCKGLDKAAVNSLHYTPSQVRHWEGKERVDTSTCQLWIIKKQTAIHGKLSYAGMCEICVSKSYQITRILKDGRTTTPTKTARLMSSSKCNLRYLSPRSTNIRLQKNINEKHYLKRINK
jgi:hypothetical protein